MEVGGVGVGDIHLVGAGVAGVGVAGVVGAVAVVVGR
jgi:hypothetical protein